MVLCALSFLFNPLGLYKTGLCHTCYETPALERLCMNTGTLIPCIKLITIYYSSTTGGKCFNEGEIDRLQSRKTIKFGQGRGGVLG